MLFILLIIFKFYNFADMHQKSIECENRKIIATELVDYLRSKEQTINFKEQFVIGLNECDIRVDEIYKK